jgi:hypothetical protein
MRFAKTAILKLIQKILLIIAVINARIVITNIDVIDITMTKGRRRT